MKVIEVGLSTNTNGQLLGPINGIIAAGGIATHPTVAVKRAVVGSSATTHTDGATVRVYRGAFNIVKNEIHFIDPPKGNTRARRNESNLPYVKAEFSGRTFLRSDYDTNMLFDDISDQFTGIAKTYTATVEGINTSGVQPGNGILFINGVFQTPTTEITQVRTTLWNVIPMLVSQVSYLLALNLSMVFLSPLIRTSIRTRFHEVV